MGNFSLFSLKIIEQIFLHTLLYSQVWLKIWQSSSAVCHSFHWWNHISISWLQNCEEPQWMKKCKWSALMWFQGTSWWTKLLKTARINGSVHYERPKFFRGSFDIRCVLGIESIEKSVVVMCHLYYRQPVENQNQLKTIVIIIITTCRCSIFLK